MCWYKSDILYHIYIYTYVNKNCMCTHLGWHKRVWSDFGSPTGETEDFWSYSSDLLWRLRIWGVFLGVMSVIREPASNFEPFIQPLAKPGNQLPAPSWGMADREGRDRHAAHAEDGRSWGLDRRTVPRWQGTTGRYPGWQLQSLCQHDKKTRNIEAEELRPWMLLEKSFKSFSSSNHTHTVIDCQVSIF